MGWTQEILDSNLLRLIGAGWLRIKNKKETKKVNLSPIILDWGALGEMSGIVKEHWD